MNKIILIIVFSITSVFTSVFICKADGYRSPSNEVKNLILAPATPSISFSPQKDRYIVSYIDDIPTIQEQAQEVLKLAGRRVLPSINAPVTRTKIKSLEVKSISVKNNVVEGKIEGFPKEVSIIDYKWSPNGKLIAACVAEDDGVRLWIINLEKLTVYKLVDNKINMFFGTDVYEWSNDSEKLLVLLVPENRGEAPSVKFQNISPITQESIGKSNPLRTYQDLLKDKLSEIQFDYYATSALGLIDINSADVSFIGNNAIYCESNLSPDGKYILVRKIKRPYSYVVPYTFFPTVTEIIDKGGVLVSSIAATSLKEYEFVSNNSSFPGPHSYGWRPDLPSTIYWLEPLDGGNGRAEVEFRDRLMNLSEPFNSQPQELYKGKYRIGGVLWGDIHNAFVLMQDYSSRNKKCVHIDPHEKTEKRVLYAFNSEDLYSDKGRIITETNIFGRSIVYTPDKYKTIYFTGNGYSTQGALPFIDEYLMEKGKQVRIWQSKDPYYEVPVEFINLKKGEFITRRESNVESPNYFSVNYRKNTSVKLTDFENPYSSMDGVTKEVVEYVRKDGVKLSGTLYLPKGYKKSDGPLPLLIWAYPSEYKNSDNAGQRSDAPNQFIRYTRTSPILWVAEGYAVLNNASFPIVGEGSAEPNDTYIEQLIGNAEAAIDKMVEMGIADRRRVAVGGHSYGAFMTANLLANSNLFAAGIARSGAYNRTLTPFGFQNEMRTFWEAPEVYMEMSPFVKADKLKSPLLLIHGEADNNSGTFTMQSERLYTAIKGNGGIVRLVLLPHESHGYVARESILHQAWETEQWLKRYLK